MSSPRILLRVVKVGGSLLTWPDLPIALRRWLTLQTPAVHVLLCGGGPFANVIRQADRIFSLADETSHWLAIDALGTAARLLAALVPEAPLISTTADLQAILVAAKPAAIVFDPGQFLRINEAHLPGTPLPHSWQATSDSIAARLAEALAADELILLKSADPPADGLAALAAAGYFDAHFPLAARSLSNVRFVNLRSV